MSSAELKALLSGVTHQASIGAAFGADINADESDDELAVHGMMCWSASLSRWGAGHGYIRTCRIRWMCAPSVCAYEIINAYVHVRQSLHMYVVT